jgi:hypothetical protein
VTLNGVYLEGAGASTRFQWVREPTFQQLTQLTHVIARRVARCLHRQGLLDAKHSDHSDMVNPAWDDDPMPPLLGHAITYRIAVGPH